MPVSIKTFDSAGQLIGPITVEKITKPDADWQRQLGTATYQIARNKGTEAPFCGNLLDNHQTGVYACVCCNLPLFSSDHKFQSGTGWPSFFAPVADENVVTHVDRSHGMVRSEILCARCDCHLGHVFNDGPKPTKLRFCVNSASLFFVDAADLKSLAEPAVSAVAT